MSEKLLIIDGHSMAFRAFYALPVESFTTSGGQHTNAVYGFLSMLAKLVETEQPTHIAVAFDPKGETFRSEMYAEYKGTRSATPPEFEGQVDLLGAVLDAMGIPQVTVDNYEADDVLATIATEGSADGYRVLVASGDRDTFQLVNDKVTVLYPGRSASDLRYMTPEAIEKQYGVGPARYPEIAALVGETADNLPGVPGVGPKTAAQWLNKYDGLENLIASADKVTGKRGAALRERMADVKRNRQINALVTDMDLPISPAECLAAEPDREQLESLFDTLQFTGLRERVYKSMAPLWGFDSEDQFFLTGEVEEEEDEDVKPKPPVVALTPDVDLGELLESLMDVPVGLWGRGRLAATEPRLDLLAASSEEMTLVIETTQVTADQEAALSSFLADHDQLITHDWKGLAHGVEATGWRLHKPMFDVQLAGYLANPGQRRYSVDRLVLDFLDRTHDPDDDGALFTTGQAETSTVPGAAAPSPAQERAGETAQVLLELYPPIRKDLKNKGALALLNDVEIPVSVVLQQMESTGIAIDVQKLRDLRDEYDQEVQAAAADAYAAIGHETNLGSPKQLQVVLFEELDMPKTRKTKTGYTTNAEALSDLYEKTGHPFLEALLLHRERIKLVQMIDGLLSEVQPDGRIHTTFSQTASVTGRLASSEPNLQNIPQRTETGRRIREVFVAGHGMEDLMSIDYSQVEMRIMAHLSADEDLIAAFQSGEDLHKTMASQVFGVPVENVDSRLRERIKAVSYGLAYGLSPYGLSRQLGVPVEEASRLRDQYFERFGGVGRYLQEVVEEARVSGYTETMMGRRRYFPELNSRVRRVRDTAERAALNAPVQGSAADIIKVAMITVSEGLKEGNYQSQILLQVHDELVLEIAPGESEAVAELVETAMAQSAELRVPLDVAVGSGYTWRAAAH